MCHVSTKFAASSLPDAYLRSQGCPVLVLEGHRSACFTYFTSDSIIKKLFPVLQKPVNPIDSSQVFWSKEASKIRRIVGHHCYKYSISTK